MSLLEVKDLCVSIHGLRALHNVCFDLKPSECLSLVGESGCGKTMCALSIMGLLPNGAIIDQGEILYHEEDLVKASEQRMAALRGRRMAMIFQDALTALNPYLRISEQLTEGIIHHNKVSKKEAFKLAIEMLHKVGIPDANKRINDYPHMFSGGMLQRIMIAIALILKPDLLLADEPTSALDVTLQAQVLKLMDQLRDSLNTSMILITHDLGVAASGSDKLAVIYGGRIVEYGFTKEVLNEPSHPYLEALLRSNPSSRTERLEEIKGQPPSLKHTPKGCAFEPRCHLALKRCSQETPPSVRINKNHNAACWRVQDS